MGMEKAVWVPQTVAIIALAWALYPRNPYGYYVFLRWICFGTFTYVALVSLTREKRLLVWLTGATALLYNPFMRVHLNRELWSVLNVGTIAVAVFSMWALKASRAVLLPVGTNASKPSDSPVTAAANQQSQEKTEPEDASPEPISPIVSGLLDQHRLTEAELILRDALEKDPRNHRAFELLGKCLERYPEPKAAAEFYRHVASNPGKYGSVLRPFSLRKVTQLDPSDLEAWDQLAQFHEGQNHYASALDALLPLADRLQHEGSTDKRMAILARIEEVSSRALKTPWLISGSSTEAPRLRTCLARAEPFIAQKRRLVQKARVEGLSGKLAASPIAAVPEDLWGFQRSGQRTIVPSDYLATVLNRVRIIRSEQGPLPPEFDKGIAQDPQDVPDAYDPNLLLKAFSSVRLKKGWFLDYVYRHTGHEASPLLYARESSQPRLRSVAEFAARYELEVKGFAPSYPQVFAPAVEFDAGPVGAVELAIFLNEAPYFHWVWHALYERHVLLFTKKDRDAGLETYDPTGRGIIEAQELGAKVRLTDGDFEVEMMTRGHDCYEISSWKLRPPHRVLRVEHKAIARSTVRVLY